MLRIAICDDEKVIAGQIENNIVGICERESIGIDIDVFYSGISLEKKIVLGMRYDLIYLDIEMSMGDGITTAKHIRDIDENVILIFVSGYDKYVMELFRLDVFSFIKKPIDKEQFSSTFLEANSKVCNKNAFFTFKYRNEEFKVLCKDIVYFESNARRIIIHTCEENYIFNGRLSDVEKKLENGKITFLRIHQSFLVNYLHIRSRTRIDVTIMNGVKLPISEERQKRFSEMYGKCIRGEINV